MSRAIFVLPPYDVGVASLNQPSWEIGRIPPIGLITIASYLQSKGHEVKVIDCRALILEYKTNDYIPFILREVEVFQPDMVGINILTALFSEAKMIASEIKSKYPKLLLVAGGVHPSIEPELTFKQNQFIDAICIGAGEEVCLDILEGLQFNDIKGLMVKGNTEKYEPRAVEMNIDKYPFPDYRLGNSAFYTGFTTDTLNGWGYKGLGVLSSRSCPYSCKFCASDWSKPFRYHSPEYVIEMAKYLLTYDIDVITFYDDTIAAMKERLNSICEGFIKAKLFYPNTNKRWFGAMRANQVNPEVLKLMKAAGCFGVSMGIETGSDRMLKVINKKTNVEMNRQACNYVTEAGLSLGISFMMGIPGETEFDMRQTIDFMRETICQTKGIGSFRPLPGSPFYDEFINNGTLIKEDINWSNLGNFTITPDRLFCDVPRERFETLFDEASRLSYNNRWVAIHDDVLSKYRTEITLIARRTKVKVAKSDHYESTAHVAYSLFSMVTIYNAALAIVRTIIPYGIRKRVRPILGLKIRRKAAG